MQTDYLKQRQSLDLDAKIQMTKNRIREWYDFFDGEVYVSFSGGKDSRVLLDIVWSIYPDVPGVFSNTGLEYPEIVQLVKKMRDAGKPIVIVRPKKTFRDVVLEDGFPLVSKKVARAVRILRDEKDNPRWANSYRLYNTGIKRDGTYSKASIIPNKYRPLVEAPFKTTELCCDRLKKEPMKTFQKESGRFPITGMMLDEGGNRATNVKKCNAFDSKEPMSSPMLFWNTGDVWEYIERFNIEIASIYKSESNPNGEERTGCMFCGFGVQFDHKRNDDGLNRFQRMKKTHPKQWNYCINKLGMGEAFHMLGIPYESDDDEQFDLFDLVKSPTEKPSK